MYAALALPLLHVGLVDQARARLETALARARRLGQPMAHMVALWFSSLFEVRLGNTDRVATLADTMRAIVEDAALAQGYGPSRWYRGWAEARLGASLEGYRSIRHAFEHNARLGMYCGGPEVLGYATEALVLAGDWDAAQQQFDEAMKLAERLAERAYLPQLLMLRARIALAKEDLGAAREATYAALHEAHDQKAPWLELAALVALCELDPPMPEDFDALQEACARLSEGSDTSLVIKARELLGGSTGCTR